jgi:hypothetical protein
VDFSGSFSVEIEELLAKSATRFVSPKEKIDPFYMGTPFKILRKVPLEVLTSFKK